MADKPNNRTSAIYSDNINEIYRVAKINGVTKLSKEDFVKNLRTGAGYRSTIYKALLDAGVKGMGKNQSEFVQYILPEEQAVAQATLSKERMASKNAKTSTPKAKETKQATDVGAQQFGGGQTTALQSNVQAPKVDVPQVDIPEVTQTQTSAPVQTEAKADKKSGVDWRQQMYDSASQIKDSANRVVTEAKNFGKTNIPTTEDYASGRALRAFGGGSQWIDEKGKVHTSKANDYLNIDNSNVQAQKNAERAEFEDKMRQIAIDTEAEQYLSTHGREAFKAANEWGRKLYDDYLDKEVDRLISEEDSNIDAELSAIEQRYKDAPATTGYAKNDGRYEKEKILTPSALQERLGNKVYGSISKLLSDKNFMDEVETQAIQLDMSKETYIQKFVLPELEKKFGDKLDKSILSRYMPKGDLDYITRGVRNWIPSLIMRASSKPNEVFNMEQRADEEYGKANDKKGTLRSYATTLGRGAVEFADPVFPLAFKAGGAIANGVGRAMKVANPALSLSTYAARFGTAAENTMLRLLSAQANRTIATRAGEFASKYLATLPKEMLGQGLGMNIYGAMGAGVNAYKNPRQSNVDGSFNPVAEAGVAMWDALTDAGGFASGAGFAIAMPFIHGGWNVLGGGWKAESSILSKLGWGAGKVGYDALSIGATAGVMQITNNIGKYMAGEDMDWSANAFIHETAIASAMKFNPSMLLRVKDMKEQAKLYGSRFDQSKLGKWAKDVMFTKDELQEIYDATGTKNLADALEYIFPDTKGAPYGSATTAVSRAQTNYLELMNKLSWDAQNKLAMGLTGSFTLQRPRCATFRTVTDQKGNNIVLEKDAEGNILSSKMFKTEEEKDAFIYERGINAYNEDFWRAYIEAVNKDKELAEQIVETVAANNGKTREEVDKIFRKEPLRRTDLEWDMLEQVMSELEGVAYPEGEVHVEKSENDGRKVEKEADVLSDEPNVEAIAGISGAIDGIAEELQQAVKDERWGEDYLELKKQGISDEQAYEMLTDPDGRYKYNEAELKVLAKAIDASHAQQGFLSQVGLEIEQTVSEITNKATSGAKVIDGNPMSSEVAVTLTDADGNECILLSGNITFENGRCKSEQPIVFLAKNDKGKWEQHSDKADRFVYWAPWRVGDLSSKLSAELEAKAEAAVDPEGKLRGQDANNAQVEGQPVEQNAEQPVVEGAPAQGEPVTKTTAPKTDIGNGAPDMPKAKPVKGTMAGNKAVYEEGKIEGSLDSIRLSDGTKAEGKYVLVDADSLSPSHNPETFKQSEGVPRREDGTTLNDRDYEHDMQAQQSVRSHSANYDERALQDTPVVTKDGIVVSGNDRTMAGQLAGKNGSDKAYIDYLLNHAEKFGFTREQVEQMIAEGKHPRVVMELAEDVPYTTETYAKFNKTAMKKRNVVEEAVAQGKVLREKNETIGKLTSLFELKDVNNLSDLYGDEEKSRQLIQFLVEDGVISKEEAIEWLNDDGVMSDIGKKKFETIMTGIVLDEASIRLLNNPDYKLGKVRQNIAYSIAELMKNQRLGEYSMLNSLNKALELFGRAKGQGAKNAGKLLSVISQKDMHTDKALMDEYSEEEILLAMQCFSGQKNFKNFFAEYNKRAKDASNGQLDMFGSGEPKTKQEITKELIQLVYGTDRRTIELLERVFRAKNGEYDTSATNEGEANVGSNEGTTEQRPVAEGADAQDGVTAPVRLTGPKNRDRNAIGEPEPFKFKARKNKRGDSHDIVWYFDKKKYGSTTAVRDSIEALIEQYGDAGKVLDAWERGEVNIHEELPILKKLAEGEPTKVEEAPADEQPYSWLDEYRSGSGIVRIPEEKQQEVANKFIEEYKSLHDGNIKGVIPEMQRKFNIGYNLANKLVDGYEHPTDKTAGNQSINNYAERLGKIKVERKDILDAVEGNKEDAETLEDAIDNIRKGEELTQFEELCLRRYLDYMDEKGAEGTAEPNATEQRAQAEMPKEPTAKVQKEPKAESAQPVDAKAEAQANTKAALDNFMKVFGENISTALGASGKSNGKGKFGALWGGVDNQTTTKEMLQAGSAIVKAAAQFVHALAKQGYVTLDSWRKELDKNLKAFIQEKTNWDEDQWEEFVGEIRKYKFRATEDGERKSLDEWVADEANKLNNNNENGNTRTNGNAGGEVRGPKVGINETSTDGRLRTERTGESNGEQQVGGEPGTDTRPTGNISRTSEKVGDELLGSERGSESTTSGGVRVQPGGESGNGRGRGNGHDGGRGGDGRSGDNTDLSPNKPVASDPTSKGGKKTYEPKNQRNYSYAEDQKAPQKNKSKEVRLSDNASAIELLHKLITEDRDATAEEREILARFSGWGGLDVEHIDNEGHINVYGNAAQKALVAIIKKLDPEAKMGLAKAVKNAGRTSFYTPVPIARAMNNFLKKAGFKNGSMLDPSMGLGVFEGTLPESIKNNVSINGVELDWLTGNLVKRLYPDANIKINGFEKVGVAPNSHDVVISNIPFGDFGVADPSWVADKSPVRNHAQKRIHNYFAVKMLESTKPGGLCVIMTSNAIMDTKGNKMFREYIADNAELVGAIRLPDNTFAGAGTKVVTDVLFLRKYRNEEDRATTLQDTEYASTKEAFLSEGSREIDGVNISFNGYYDKHPEMMIGDVKAGGQYREDEFGLHYNNEGNAVDEISSKMEGLVSKLIGDREGKLIDTKVTKRETLQAVRESFSGDADFISTDNIIVQNGKVGKLIESKNEYGEVERTFVEDTTLKKVKDRVEKMIPLRKAMKELISEEINRASDEHLAGLREALTKAYNDYVEKFGRLQEKDNDYIETDINGLSIRNLEKWKDGKFVGLSDIFTKKVIKAELDKSAIKSPQDVIAASLSEYGDIRESFLKEFLGDDWREATKDLLFEIPNSDGSFETKDAYLSGDVKTKLESAKIAAETDERFKKNVKALEAVQPKDVPFDDITVHMGARWIPIDMYNEFAKDALGLHYTGRKWGGAMKSKIEYTQAADNYTFRLEENEMGPEAVKWATGRCSASKIFESAFLDKSIIIRDKISSSPDVYEINVAETEAANDKVVELRESFEDWLSQKSERIEKVQRLYNDLFNRTVLREWDGSHLTVPGLMGMELRPHQKDAVWMLLNNRGGIVDHIVGAGKTLVMQSAIMEMRRMGIAKKPMIVALKSTVGQIAKEFAEAYPHARILYPTEKDFEKKNRKNFLAKIATNDYDCVILSHENYCNLPHSEEVENRVAQERISQIEATLEYMRGKEQDAWTKRQIKGLEKRIANEMARIEQRRAKRTESEFTFEDMGIDYMFVDECQAFKNLAYTSSSKNVAGLGKAEGSDVSASLLLGIRYLQSLHQGDYGTVFLSGTTMTNSVVEAYSLMNYLRPGELDRLGLNTFDAWASCFTQKTKEYEYGVTNELKEKTRYRNFDNLPELARMYKEIADVRNDENLELPKPKKNVHIVTVPQTEKMKEINQEIIKMVKSKNGNYFGKGTSDKTPWGLVATDLSTKAALSLKLIDETIEDEGGKIPVACKNVKEMYDKFAEHKGCQMVFLDKGVGKELSGGELAREVCRELIRQTSEASWKSFLSEYKAKKPLPKGMTIEQILGSSQQELSEGKKKQSASTTTWLKKACSAYAEKYDMEYDVVAENVKMSSGGYSAYRDIINRLVNEYGIPRNEIVDIHEAKTQADRKELFRKANEGEVRILIGGTKNMGTGVNAQVRLVALHHLDIPWTPADVDQRNGRGARQGNVIARDHNDNKVEVFYYATEGSLDMYRYQLQDIKGKMFDRFKMAALGDRSFDEGADGDALDPAEVVAMLSGNSVILEKSKQDKLVAKLRRAKRSFQAEYQRNTFEKKYLEKEIERLEQRAVQNAEDIKRISPEFKPNEKGVYPTNVTVVVDGEPKSFDKPKEAGQYIIDAINLKRKIVLEGYGLKAEYSAYHGDFSTLNSEIPHRIYCGYHYDPTYLGTIYRSLLQKVFKDGDIYNKEIAEKKDFLSKLDIGDGIWPKEQELEDAIEKQKELDREYRALANNDIDYEIGGKVVYQGEEYKITGVNKEDKVIEIGGPGKVLEFKDVEKYYTKAQTEEMERKKAQEEANHFSPEIESKIDSIITDGTDSEGHNYKDYNDNDVTIRVTDYSDKVYAIFGVVENIGWSQTDNSPGTELIDTLELLGFQGKYKMNTGWKDKKGNAVKEYAWMVSKKDPSAIKRAEDAIRKYYGRKFTEANGESRLSEGLDEPEMMAGNSSEVSNDTEAKRVVTDFVTERIGGTDGLELVMNTQEEGQKVANENHNGIAMQAKLSALGKAVSFIRRSLSGKQRGSFSLELPSATIAKIKAVMGRDYDTHNITANSIVHAKKNHGINGIKNTEKSIPLRDEDFELAPYIMTAPSRVEKGTSDITGRDSIRFYKVLENGYVVVAEKELKNSPDDMETITMWAEKSSSVADARRNSSPAIDVQNVITGIDAAKIRKDAETAIENDVKNSKEHKLTTSLGVVYGWAEGNKIHLTPEGINPNTPIHEYTHLWAKAVQKKAPELWKNIKSLLKDNPLVNEIMGEKGYENLSEDGLYSEVLSRVSGKNNAGKLEEAAQRLLDRGHSKEEVKGMLANFKEAVKKAWTWIGKNLFGIEKFDSVEEVTDRVLYDLVNKTDLGLDAHDGVDAEFHKVTSEELKDPHTKKCVDELEKGEIIDVKTAKELVDIWKKNPNDPRVKDKNYKVKVMRGMQVLDVNGDGNKELFPPMAARIAGRFVEGAKGGEIFVSDYDQNMSWFETQDGRKIKVNDTSVHKVIESDKKGEYAAWYAGDVKPENKLKINKDGQKDLPRTEWQPSAWFVLDKGGDKNQKGQGDTIARTNPYWHVSNTTANDQFAAAWIRPNLVTVECYVPFSEMISGHREWGAKNSVGFAPWTHGVLTNALMAQGHEGRIVALSRYCQIGRMLTAKETAEGIRDYIGDYKVEVPENTVTPQVRVELEKLGVKIGPPEKKANKKEQYREMLEAGLYVDNTIRFSETLDGDKQSTRSASAQEIASHVEKVGKGVQIHDSVETVTNAKAKKAILEGRVVKGYWDHKTNSVHLYLPNIHSKYEAEKTIVHEEIGHKGMRDFFNTETEPNNYNKFMDMIWADKSNVALREFVKKYAPKKGWDIYEAIDEYIAREAEKDVTPENLSFWGKIKHYFTEALRKAGYYWNPNINDVRYAIWLAKRGRNNPNDPLFKARKNALLEKMRKQNVKPAIKDGVYVDKSATKPMETKDASRNSEALDEENTTPMGKAVRDDYDRRLRTRSFKMREAYIDSMESLRVLQELIGGKDVKDSENAYLAENHITSIAEAQWNKFKVQKFQPIDDAINKCVALLGGKSKNALADIEMYIYQKHGLERNRSMFVRKALDKYAKSKAGREAEKNYQYMMENHLSPDDMADIEGMENIETADRLRSKYLNEEAKLFYKMKNGELTYAEYIAGLDEFIKENINNEYDPNKVDYSGISEFDKEKKVSGKDIEYDEASIIENVMSMEDCLGQERIGEIWDAIKKATDFSVDYSYESGQADSNLRDNIKSMYRWYVPLRGWAEDKMEDIYDRYHNDTGNGVGKVLKKAHGRDSLADSPLATISKMANDAILWGERNKMLQNFLRLNTRNQNDAVKISDIWEEAIPDGKDDMGVDKVKWEPALPKIAEDATSDEIADAIDDFNARMRKQEIEGTARKVQGKPQYPAGFKNPLNSNAHAVRVYVNGTEKTMWVTGDPRAAQALRGEIVHKNNAVLPAKWLMNTTAKLATSYSPEFILSNAERDTLFSSANIASKEGPAYFAKFTKNQAIAAALMGVTGIGGDWHKGEKLGFWKINYTLKGDHGKESIFEKYYRGREPKSDIEKKFFEFMDNGGRTGFIAQIGLEEHKDALKASIKGTTITAAGVNAICAVGKAIPKAVEQMNMRAELINRFAVYMTSRQMGRSKLRSVADAKEVSVNFNRHGAGNATEGWAGSSAGFFRDYYMFFNAGMQSVELLNRNLYKREARGLKGYLNPKNMSGTTATKTLAYLGVVPAMVGTAFAMMMMDDDDEKYSNIPSWDRRNNICIPAGDGYVKIALPIELRAFWGMGDIMASLKHKRLQTEESPGFAMAGQISQMMPIDVLEAGEQRFKKDTWWIPLLPTAARPGFENIKNIDWTGKPIQKDNKYFEDAPQWTLAYKSTPKPLVEFCKFVHNKTRDGVYTAQETDATGLNMSPAKVEHVLKSYFSGAYSMIGKTLGVATADEFDAAHLPMLSRVWGSFTEKEADATTNAKYYAYKHEADNTNKEYANKANRTNPLAKAELDNSARGKRASIYKMYDAKISYLSKAVNNDNVPADVKVQLKQTIAQLKRELVDKLDAVE